MMRLFLLFFVFCGFQGYSQELSWTQFSPVISATGTDPKVGADASGNALSVWIDDSSTDIMASTWDGSSWSTPEAILSGSNAISSVDLGVDTDGNGLAAWSSAATPGTDDIVQASVYTPGMGWAAPVTISDASFSNEPNTKPRVSVDNQGGATVLWRMVFTGTVVGASRFFDFTGGTWNRDLASNPFFASSTPFNIDFPKVVSFFSEEVIDMDATFDGQQAVATFAADSSRVYSNLGANILNMGSPESGWSAFEARSGFITDPRPAVAVNPADSEGRAIIVWNNDGGPDIEYTTITGFEFLFGFIVNPLWSAVASIPGSTAPTNTASPSIAQDSSSNALAAWISLDGADGTIYTSFYNRSMGSWSTAEAISSASSDVANPEVDFRLDGTAVVVWEQGGDDSGENALF